jgi:hypothetical protein
MSEARGLGREAKKSPFYTAADSDDRFRTPPRPRRRAVPSAFFLGFHDGGYAQAQPVPVRAARSVRGKVPAG